jgi:hypothetical protein
VVDGADLLSDLTDYQSGVSKSRAIPLFLYTSPSISSLHKPNIDPSDMTRGMFIVLEGLDRSGKSTQVSNLVEKLDQSGRKAVLRKFPGMPSGRVPVLPSHCTRSDHDHRKDDRQLPTVQS